MGAVPNEIVVFVTTASEEEAVRIARSLVESRMAACANVIPQVRSVFRWEGKVSEELECLMILKSRGELFGALEASIRQLHTYKVPEIIAVPLVAGSAAYLQWVRDETRKVL
jgi:periplasmic divalent cation tolerance protein